jgi:endo-1,4-beta-xylanase
MRKTITSYSGAALSAMMLFIVTGCAKFSDREFSVDKPESILNQEAINALPSLKSLINRTASPNFRLGTVVPANTYQTGGSAIFKIADRNFDEVVLETEMKHGSIVQTDGSLNISGIKQFVDFAAQKNVGVYGQVLTHHLNQNATYLNDKLKGLSGTTKINFDGDATGQAYGMTGNSSAEVTADPDGVTPGKVLRVGTTALNANQSFVKIPVTLPAGIKLRHCASVTLDIYIINGIFGQGMRLGLVNNTDLSRNATYNSPSGFGASANSWLRGKVIMPIANLNLTEAEKDLSTFTIYTGSATGAGLYYIDNVIFSWNAEKTAAEKNTIVSAELNRFISGVVDSTKSVVKAWDVVKDPMDDSNPTQLKTGIGKSQGANEFYWQDYMGTSYAAKAFQYARQHVNSGDKLFISDNGLESNLAKCNGLISYIQNTESQGAIIDGISTQMHISISTDKSNIAQHLSLLAATQKLIRISELDVSLNGTTTSSATATQLQAQADMYKYVIEKYFELIPPAQRYGITFWSPQDRPSGATWLANQPVGIWNGQWVRKVGYKAVVEALEAKGK